MRLVRGSRREEKSHAAARAAGAVRQGGGVTGRLDEASVLHSTSSQWQPVQCGRAGVTAPVPRRAGRDQSHAVQNRTTRTRKASDRAAARRIHDAVRFCSRAHARSATAAGLPRKTNLPVSRGAAISESAATAAVCESGGRRCPAQAASQASTIKSLE